LCSSLEWLARNLDFTLALAIGQKYLPAGADAISDQNSAEENEESRAEKLILERMAD